MVTHSNTLAWRIPWTEEPGGLRPWARTELDTTEATWHARGPWEAGPEGAWGRRGQESAVKPEQGLLPGLTTLFPWQPEVPPLRGGGERASAAQQLSGRGHQQVRRGHQVRMATLPSSVWGGDGGQTSGAQGDGHPPPHLPG